MISPLALAVALAVQARDTLLYNLALNPAGSSIAFEARLTVAGAQTVVLSAPPGSGSGRTSVAGLSASDDRGRPLPVQRIAGTYVIDVAGAGAMRFRYRLDFRSRVAESSTGAGLDPQRLYAVTRSLFVAPDPIAYRKTGRPYPVLRVAVLAPEGWRVIAGWAEASEGRGGDGSGGWSGLRNVYAPADGDDLMGSTVAAAPDFRLYQDTAGGTTWRLAIRGERHFGDSALISIIQAGLRGGAAALGPAPVARVTYTGDVGRKGRVSGSLQGTSSIGLVWEAGEILELPRSQDTFHETLHLWFGGRMESERWWTEGVTDYLAARLYAEWTGRPDDLAALCFASLRNYAGIPHRTEITMEAENRRRLGGDNTELLVYRKGMLAGLLLDAAIRRESRGRRALDDASRDLLDMARDRISRTVRDTDIRRAVSRAGGRQAERVFERVVAGTELITAAEVADALRDVTGRPFLPPPLAIKRGKTLRSP